MICSTFKTDNDTILQLYFSVEGQPTEPSNQGYAQGQEVQTGTVIDMFNPSWYNNGDYLKSNYIDNDSNTIILSSKCKFSASFNIIIVGVSN